MRHTTRRIYLGLQSAALCVALLAGAPAVRCNAVTTTAAPTVDFEGAARGNPPSIGAFEGGLADTTAPAVAIATPTGGAVKVLPAIAAIATDEPGGSGVKQVLFFLRHRKADSSFEYWGLRSTVWSWGAPVSFAGTVDAGTTGGWIAGAGKPAGTQLPAGANLGDGTYNAYATATDNAGNSRTSVVKSFVVDNTLPTGVAISAPLDGSILKSFAAVSGTATDNTGGSGIGRIDLTLRRLSDLKYWDGTAWGTAAVALPTPVSGNTWLKRTGLPVWGANADTQLQDGKFVLTAVPVDRASNKGAVATNHFSLDRTPPPAVTILAPMNLSSVKAFTSAAGSAADNAGGSGILKVEVTLRRSSDLMYWDGTSWVVTIAQLPSVFSGSAWSKSTGFPAAGTDLNTQLVEGKYILGVSATDKAGNKGATASSAFTVDRTVPTVTIGTPATANTVTSLTILKGTAFDVLSGAASINLALKRGSDGQFWDGAAWVATASTLTTAAKPTTGGNATWTYGGTGQPLPAGAGLANGSYSLTARAVDKAGNVSAAVVSNFILALNSPISAPVLAASPVVTTSPVQLSSIAATAGGRVQLVFTGALKTAAAVEPSRYNVGAATVESASVSSASSVSLGLDAGAVHTGDKLTVGYDLLDVNGLAVKGQASVVVK